MHRFRGGRDLQDLCHVRVRQELADAKLSTVCRPDPSAAYNIEFSPSGRFLLSLHASGFVVLLDTTDGLSELSRKLAHEGGTNVATFLGEFRVFTGGADSRIREWRIERGELILYRELIGHVGDVKNVFVLGGGDRLLSCAFDGTLRLWDIGEGAVEPYFPPACELEGRATMDDEDEVRSMMEEEESAEGEGLERLWSSGVMRIEALACMMWISREVLMHGTENVIFSHPELARICYRDGVLVLSIGEHVMKVDHVDPGTLCRVLNTCDSIPLPSDLLLNIQRPPSEPSLSMIRDCRALVAEVWQTARLQNPERGLGWGPGTLATMRMPGGGTERNPGRDLGDGGMPVFGVIPSCIGAIQPSSLEEEKEHLKREETDFEGERHQKTDPSGFEEEKPRKREETDFEGERHQKIDPSGFEEEKPRTREETDFEGERHQNTDPSGFEGEHYQKVDPIEDNDRCETKPSTCRWILTGPMLCAQGLRLAPGGRRLLSTRLCVGAPLPSALVTCDGGGAPLCPEEREQQGEALLRLYLERFGALASFSEADARLVELGEEIGTLDKVVHDDRKDESEPHWSAVNRLLSCFRGYTYRESVELASRWISILGIRNLGAGILPENLPDDAIPRLAAYVARESMPPVTSISAFAAPVPPAPTLQAEFEGRTTAVWCLPKRAASSLIKDGDFSCDGNFAFIPRGGSVVILDANACRTYESRANQPVLSHDLPHLDPLPSPPPQPPVPIPAPAFRPHDPPYLPTSSIAVVPESSVPIESWPFHSRPHTWPYGRPGLEPVENEDTVETPYRVHLRPRPTPKELVAIHSIPEETILTIRGHPRAPSVFAVATVSGHVYLTTV